MKIFWFGSFLTEKNILPTKVERFVGNLFSSSLPVPYQLSICSEEFYYISCTVFLFGRIRPIGTRRKHFSRKNSFSISKQTKLFGLELFQKIFFFEKKFITTGDIYSVFALREKDLEEKRWTNVSSSGIEEKNDRKTILTEGRRFFLSIEEKSSMAFAKSRR